MSEQRPTLAGDIERLRAQEAALREALAAARRDAAHYRQLQKPPAVASPPPPCTGLKRIRRSGRRLARRARLAILRLILRRRPARPGRG